MAVNLDKSQAIYAGNIESVVFTTDVQNGAITTLGAMATGEREVVQGANPVDVTEDEILLVYTPEVLYETGKGILDFVNKAGIPARAYHYTVGDIVTVTDDMIDGTSAVNQYLIPVNGSNKLKTAADLSSGTKFAAKVIEKRKLFGKAATSYRVVSC